MNPVADRPVGNNERAIILELSTIAPMLTRPSEHLDDSAHPEYASCRSRVDDGVARMDLLTARLKQLRIA